MLNKSIKVEVPKTKMCSRCQDPAKVNDLKLTEDDQLMVSFMCDCGQEDWVVEKVTFI